MTGTEREVDGHTIARSLGRRLRFAQLELVLQLAECGNLADAAQRLHLSRAGVSKALKELERSLGRTLFERSQKGMHPTAAGLRVATHARLLINELRQLTDEVAGSDAGTSSVLRIGMPSFVAEHLAPHILRRMAEQAPGAVRSVHLLEGRLHSLIELLLRGDVDAVLTLYAPRAVDGLDLSLLQIRPLAAVPMVVVAAPSLGVPQHRRQRWQDLAPLPWILPPAGTHQRRALDEMFTAHGNQAPLPVVESGTLVANSRLAAAGLGLAVVPVQAAAADVAAGRLHVVDVRPPLPETTIALMMRKVSAIYMESLQRLADAALQATQVAPTPAGRPARSPARPASTPARGRSAAARGSSCR